MDKPTPTPTPTPIPIPSPSPSPSLGPSPSPSLGPSPSPSPSPMVRGQVPCGWICSVCLEAVVDPAGERSIAKLKCGHHFHLDCIGSAFNAKGAMQCPNCRQVEQGQWLFANGCLHEELAEEVNLEVDYAIYSEMANIAHYQDEMFGNLHWCPYQGFHPHFSVFLEERNNQASRYPSMILNGRHHMRTTDPSYNCPYLAERNLWPHHLSVTSASTSSSTLTNGLIPRFISSDGIRFLHPSANRPHQQRGQMFQTPLFVPSRVRRRPDGAGSVPPSSRHRSREFGVNGRGSNLLHGSTGQFVNGGSMGGVNGSMGQWGANEQMNWGSIGVLNPMLSGSPISWHGENQVESWIRGQAYAPRGPFGIHHWWTWVPLGGSQTALTNTISTAYPQRHFTASQGYSGH